MPSVSKQLGICPNCGAKFEPSFWPAGEHGCSPSAIDVCKQLVALADVSDEWSDFVSAHCALGGIVNAARAAIAAATGEGADHD